jgi:hypothetical protein
VRSPRVTVVVADMVGEQALVGVRLMGNATSAASRRLPKGGAAVNRILLMLYQQIIHNTTCSVSIGVFTK